MAACEGQESLLFLYLDFHTTLHCATTMQVLDVGVRKAREYERVVDFVDGMFLYMYLRQFL